MSNKPLKLDHEKNNDSENQVDNPLLITLEENRATPFNTQASNITNRTCRISLDKIAARLIEELQFTEVSSRRQSLNGEIYQDQVFQNYNEEHKNYKPYPNQDDRYQLLNQTYVPNNDLAQVNYDIVSESTMTLKGDRPGNFEPNEYSESFIKNRDTLTRTRRNHGDNNNLEGLVISGLRVFKKKMININNENSNNINNNIYNENDKKADFNEVKEKKSNNNFNGYQKVSSDEDSHNSVQKICENNNELRKDLVLGHKIQIREEDEYHANSNDMIPYRSENEVSENEEFETKNKHDLYTAHTKHGNDVNINNTVQKAYEDKELEENKKEEYKDKGNKVEHKIYTKNDEEDSMVNENKTDFIDDFPKKTIPDNHHDINCHSSGNKKSSDKIDNQIDISDNFEDKKDEKPLKYNPLMPDNAKKEDNVPFISNKPANLLKKQQINLKNLDNRSDNCINEKEEFYSIYSENNRSLPNICYMSNTEDEYSKEEKYNQHLDTIKESENESHDLLHSKITKEFGPKIKLDNPLEKEYLAIGESSETENQESSESMNEYADGYDFNINDVEGLLKLRRPHKQYFDDEFYKELTNQPTDMKKSMYISDKTGYNKEEIVAEFMKKSDQYDFGCPNFMIQPHLMNVDEGSPYTSHLMLAQLRKINEFNRKKKFLGAIDKNQKSLQNLLEALVEGDVEAFKMSSFIKDASKRIKTIKKSRIIEKDDKIMASPEDMYDFVDLKNNNND